MKLHNIIKRPITTEKSAAHKEANTYVFVVDKKADKTAVKTAVEQLFSVKVKAVRTLIQRGKVKRFGQGQGRTTAFKKAVVTLSSGKIELFEGV